MLALAIALILGGYTIAYAGAQNLSSGGGVSLAAAISCAPKAVTPVSEGPPGVRVPSLPGLNPAPNLSPSLLPAPAAIPNPLPGLDQLGRAPLPGLEGIIIPPIRAIGGIGRQVGQGLAGAFHAVVAGARLTLHL